MQTPQVTSQRQRRLLVSLLVLALVLRLVMAVATQSWQPSSKENFWRFGFEMGRIGAALAAGEGFASPFQDRKTGPTAWMAPIYPGIIGGVFYLFGTYSVASAVVLAILQVGISLLNCYLLYALGRRLFGPQVGLLAALLLAIYPPGLHFTVQKIWSTDLFVCGILVGLWQFLRLREAPTVNNAAWTGVTLGLISLVDPIIFAFWPLALAWLLVQRQSPWLARLRASVVVVALLWVTITPWLVRNYLVFGHFVFIKSNLGYVLWSANASPPPALETSPEGNRAPQQETGSSPGNSSLQEDEGEEAAMDQQALRLMRQHPWQYASNILQRVPRYWLLVKPGGSLQSVTARGAYYILLCLAAVGLCLSLQASADVRLLQIALLALPLPYYLTVVRLLHYRFPVEVLLMFFASYALWRVLGRSSRGLPG
jgi:4-amino-4-deoxy-L-arabinose transferase-like glycosyltransferase